MYNKNSFYLFFCFLTLSLFSVGHSGSLRGETVCVWLFWCAELCSAYQRWGAEQFVKGLHRCYLPGSWPQTGTIPLLEGRSPPVIFSADLICLLQYVSVPCGCRSEPNSDGSAENRLLLCVISGSASFKGPGLCGLRRRVLSLFFFLLFWARKERLHLEEPSDWDSFCVT